METTFKFVCSLVVLAAWAYRYVQARRANQQLRDHAQQQAARQPLRPDEVAPPPSGRVVLTGDGARPDRIVAHTRVRWEQTAAGLTLTLPEATTAMHCMTSFLGYAMMLGGAALQVSSWVGYAEGHGPAVWILCALIVAAGYGLLFGESPVYRVDVTDNELRCHRICGIWFRTSFTVSRISSLRFRGEPQSPLEMEQFQRAPFYDLTIQRYGLSRRYLLACDAGAGDWLTSVLSAWQRLGRTPHVADLPAPVARTRAEGQFAGA